MPLRKAVLEAAGRSTSTPQQSHRVIGEHAVGPTAVCDDLDVLGETTEPAAELVDRHRQGPRDVAGSELHLGTHIDHDHIAGIESQGELVTGDLFELVAPAEISQGEIIDAAVVSGRDVAQRRPQRSNPVGGKAVVNAGTFASCHDEPCHCERTKMKRRVGYALADLVGQSLDVARTLGQHIDDLGSPAVRKRLRHLGETVEQRIFRVTITHCDHLLKDFLDKVSCRQSLFKRFFEEVPMVRIHEFVDEGLGHSSYVIDLADGTGAVIDPPRFPTSQEALAEREHLRVAWTIDTHSHADYVTGSPGLAARAQATFVAPGLSRLETAHRAVRDGERVALSASVAIVAIATPGHTPDHHAYLLEEDGKPVGLFTGGSLMVGTVGRTDLCGPELAVPLAHEMFRSLHRFDDLPDELTVYPTHGAGSFCSAPGAAERITTLGRERRTNPLLHEPTEDAFVEHLVGGFGTFPSYFARLPELNRCGPRPYDSLPVLGRLSADELEAQIASGAMVVDVRPFISFGAGHIAGSLSNTLRPVFASWLGWLVDPERPLVFVLGVDQNRAELVRQCLDIGHERLVGELDGGIEAWTASGRALATISVVDVEHLAPTVLDVRQANEYASGHVPAATNVEVAAVAGAAVPLGELTVMCGHGERAMTAASLLTAGGNHQVSVFEGGPDTWAAATRVPLEVVQ